MTWYPAKVEIAYGSSPLSNPGTATWTDITDKVKSWGGKGGRDNEFDDIAASTCSIELHNADASMTPARDNGTNLVPWDYEYWIGPRETEDDFLTNADLSNYFSTTAVGGLFISSARGNIGVTGATNVEIQMKALGVLGPIPVTPGAVYSANVRSWHVTAAQSAYSYISWLDENLAELSRSVSATTALATVSTGTNLTITAATAPAGAYYAVLGVRQTTAGTGSFFMAYPHMQTGSSFTGTETMYDKYRPRVGNLVRISVQDSGATYRNIFTGHVEAVSLANEGGSSEEAGITLTAVDAQKYLATTVLGSAILFANQQNSVQRLYPLTDSGSSLLVGSTSRSVNYRTGNLLNANASGSLSRFGVGTASFTFGVDGPTEELSALRLAGTHPASGSGGGWVVYGTKGTTQDWTYQGWFRCSAAQAQTQTVLNVKLFDGTAYTNNTLVSITTAGLLQLEAYGGGSPGASTTAINVCDGQWHHVALTIDVTSTTTYDLRLLLDGAVVATLTARSLASGTIGTTSYFSIGGFPNVYFFTGDLSMWGISESVLTDTQIQSIYRSGVTGVSSSGATVSTAASNVLDGINWPNTARDIATISDTIGGVESGLTAMDALKRVAESVDAAVFIDGSGKVAVKARDERFYPTAGITPSEASGITPEQDLVWSLDDASLQSRVTVNGIGGGGVTVGAAAGYGVREMTRDTALSDSTATSGLANWLLYLRSKQRVRVGQITFQLSTCSPTIWDAMVNWGIASGKVLDLSQILRSQEPNLITRYFIESFDWSYDQDSMTFRVTCDLSPVKYYEEGLLRLNSSTYGQLGMYVLGL